MMRYNTFPQKNDWIIRSNKGSYWTYGDEPEYNRPGRYFTIDVSGKEPSIDTSVEYLSFIPNRVLMKWVKNDPGSPDLYVLIEREQTVMGAWNEMIHFRDPLRNNQYINVRIGWVPGS